MERSPNISRNPAQPKLLDQVRSALRTRHYSYCTEKVYIHWIRQYILFHGKRHPNDLGEEHIRQFLTQLAVNKRVSASTQNQALCALVFLYKHVLNCKLGDFGNLVWAKKSKRIPVVFTRKEVQSIMSHLSSTYWIMAMLLYGAGLRLRECLQLRVKDIDFNYNQVSVRDAKGGKDRIVPLPQKVKEPLKKHLESVKRIHEKDLKDGFGTVSMPDALERKYPNASRSYGWQFVFPAHQISADPRSGVRRRHHLYETVLQKAVKTAIRRAGIVKHAGCHNPAP